MNTTVFCYAVGTPVDQIINNIPEEWNKVFSDRFIHVYRNNSVDAYAIFATDDDNIIRFCDVKKKRENGEYTSIWLYSGIFQNMNTFGDIKFVYDVEKSVTERYNLPVPVCTKLDWKTAVRNVFRRYRNKPVYNSVPIRNNEKQWRTVADPEGDTCTDFIIIPDRWTELWETDAEEEIYRDIEDFVYSTVGYDSCYEFPTGQMITLSWSFTRTPAGVVIIHRRGIDW